MRTNKSDTVLGGVDVAPNPPQESKKKKTGGAAKRFAWRDLFSKKPSSEPKARAAASDAPRPEPEQTREASPQPPVRAKAPRQRREPEGLVGNYFDDAVLASLRPPPSPVASRVAVPQASEVAAPRHTRRALPDPTTRAGASMWAGAIDEKAVAPLRGLRRAAKCNDVSIYADTAYAAIRNLPTGTLEQRMVLWHLYLAFAAYGDDRAKDVLHTLFAADLLISGASLKDFLKSRHLRPLLKTEALRLPGTTSVAGAVAATKARLSQLCDTKQLRRENDADDNNDYLALTSDAHAKNRLGRSASGKDALSKLLAQPLPQPTASYSDTDAEPPIASQPSQNALDALFDGGEDPLARMISGR